MPAESGDTRSTELRLPRAWSMIFRGFQLARDPYKITIAVMAVIILTLGWWILGGIFNPDTNTHGQWPANADRGLNPLSVVMNPEEHGRFFSKEFWIGSANEGPPLQVEPFRQFFQPVIDLFKYTPAKSQWWYSFFGIALTLVVWGIAAGAITRIAAVQLARNEQIGIGEAIGYARKKFFDYILGPAIPLIIAGVLALINAIGGELTQVPYLGSIVVAILLPLPILSSLIIAAMVVAFIGWPLFYATISAEGSDSFDALSRTLAYITQRAWSYIKYTLTAIVYSIVVVLIVVFLASFAVYLVRWSVGLAPGLGWQDTGDPIGSSFTLAPRSYQWRDLLVGENHPGVRFHNNMNNHLFKGNNLEEFQKGLKDKKPLADLLPADVLAQLGLKDKTISDGNYSILSEFYTSRKAEDLRKNDSKFDFVWAHMNWGQKLAAWITAFWTHLLFLGLVGFAYSLFWCSGTIIYFLLRKEVDETDYEEVYIEDEEDLIPPPLPPASAPPAPVPPPPSAGNAGSPPDLPKTTEIPKLD